MWGELWSQPTIGIQHAGWNVRQTVLGLVMASCVAAVAAAQSEGSISEAPLELRFGVLGHDLDLLNDGASGVEPGVDLSVEAVFASPRVLRFLGSPRPYVGGSLNTEGETSFAGVGLDWQTPMFGGVFFQGQLGYIVHSGELDLPEDREANMEETLFLLENKALLGSRDLFRTSVGVGYRVNDQWDVGVVLEHLSHGQILGDGRNQGLDNMGVRISRRFGR